MPKKTTRIKMFCTAVALSAVFQMTVRAEDVAPAPGMQGDQVASLQAALKQAQEESAQKSRRIADLEAQLKKMNATPVVAGAPAADPAKLQQELKESKSRINELEEQLFVATDGKGVGGDVVVEELPEGVYAWTENMRRMPMGVLFPKTATIPKGEVFARFSHTAQNQTFATGGKGDAFDDMLGLEANVKVGILFGYGITGNWDVLVQRTNGRHYIKDPDTYEQGSFDLWDIMTKVKVLNEDDHFVDASVSAGTTVFWQDDDHMEFAGNAALAVEKSLWRFRVGSGLLYTSMSTFESGRSLQPGGAAPDKNYKNEYYGVGNPNEPGHTLAVPFSISFALTNRQQLFGEMAFPVSGYETGCGPSMAAGWRYNTHTHAYSIYLSNTANGSYNSLFTGGYKRDQLDLFGFDISIFF